MFAVVRTGGKQYRVAEGDYITVEKIAGDAGDSISLGDVLMAGEGADLKDVAGLSVAAEIVEQGRGDKIVIFKKKRRHNYRRKNGHRQYLTTLRITAIGDAKKPAPKKAAAKKAEDKPVEAKTEAKPETAKPAPAKKAPAKKAAPAKKTAASETGGSDTPTKAETAAKKPIKKAPAKKASTAKGATDENKDA